MVQISRRAGEGGTMGSGVLELSAEACVCTGSSSDRSLLACQASRVFRTERKSWSTLGTRTSAEFGECLSVSEIRGVGAPQMVAKSSVVPQRPSRLRD